MSKIFSVYKLQNPESVRAALEPASCMITYDNDSRLRVTGTFSVCHRYHLVLFADIKNTTTRAIYGRICYGLCIIIGMSVSQWGIVAVGGIHGGRKQLRAHMLNHKQEAEKVSL